MMSVEIHQYLDNSGGNNFTENAPRPPVGPGEENEFQSTGGHSNKSSSSHKSQASNKSNGSNGAATPRRPIKPVKVPPITGVTAADETEAPLGFEPEGSVGHHGEYTEACTPSYVKWAESMDYLLEDADGVTLFKKYLVQEKSVNLFEFYFAWKYLQDIEADNVKGIASLVKTMYKVFIKGDKGEKKLTLVTNDSRESVAKFISSKLYTKNIFDEVKNQVVDVLKREFYLPFFKSDIYSQYIQNLDESPKDSPPSSGSASARPLSSILPTVHEDSELDLHTHPGTVISSVQSDGQLSLSLTVSNMRITERLRVDSQIKPEEQAGYYLQRRDDIPPNPYHACSASYLPISALDSERQSLSSEALTDDTHSITDSSVDGFPQFTSKKSLRRYYKSIKTSAQRNPDPHIPNQTFLPPKNQRMSKVSNLAETSPEEFFNLLSEKLQRVLDEQSRKEIVRSKLSAMSEDEGTDDSRSIFSSTTGDGTANNTLNQLLVAIQAGDHDSEAQDILDMHCKRIWERSGPHSPTKSPSRSKSPDHLSLQTKRAIVPTALRPTNIGPYVRQPPVGNKIMPLVAPETPFAAAMPYPRPSPSSRHGLATFSSKAEQQSIFKPPPVQTNQNQKVVEWISRNEEIMQHSSNHAPAESDRSSHKRSSQRSSSTSASPRIHRNKLHSAKGRLDLNKQHTIDALAMEAKRLAVEDKHSSKSKSSASSSKDKRSMSRSAGDASLLSTGPSLTQRKGVPVPPQLKVAFFLPDEPIPYSVTVPGCEITLAKFKELITKKGIYRYFFKKATDDEFGQGVPHVLEEITCDSSVLPKWESKVVGYVKKVE